MSNLYGYNDYNGIRKQCELALMDETSTDGDKKVHLKEEEYDCSVDDEDENFLDQMAGGQWMEGDSLAPPCGSEIEAVHKLLELADIQEDDILYDLGCGDGRVCLEAFGPKFRCGRCVGVEIECDLVERFQCLIDDIPKEYYFSSKESSAHFFENKKRPQHEIIALHADLREVDLSEATIICLYLLPEAIALIEEKLVSLLNTSRKVRIICNSWGLRSIIATKAINVENVSMFLYTHEAVQK